MVKEFVCTTTIWIEAKDEAQAFAKLENINRHISKVFSVSAASDPDRVRFEGNEFSQEVD